ncbi:hypothetical protein V2G26_001021 [Clonostachys chloroleuca]|uniref:Uncharacterized protein n=1 Tax=Clonostachys chloroleuca TaxID=1926264 RepID=A0AA35VJQ0_9HYPO|nr:unnamed protein product [Clonostachys chloroleuca]
MSSAIAANMFRLTPQLMFRGTPKMMFSRAPQMMFRQAPRMMRPVPKEDQAGHTVSQRLRKLKHIPLELVPLAVVVVFALFAATYSSIRKFVVDKNLRLVRQGAAGREEHSSDEKHH